jgi:hypothetical protein
MELVCRYIEKCKNYAPNGNGGCSIDYLSCGDYLVLYKIEQMSLKCREKIT